MISYESFKEQIVSLTGRPDIGVAPHLMRTLGTICRSGEYPEDAYTGRYGQGGFWREPVELPGFLEYVGPIGTNGMSVRRMLSFRIELIDYWESHLVDFNILPSGDLRSMYQVARACPHKGLVYFAAGDIKVLLPMPDQKLKQDLLDQNVQAEFVITLLTSNENMGWYFCEGAETGWDRPEGLGEGEMWEEDDFPLSYSMIWQLDACLDLVMFGTAASMLRYAGHEAEARLMHGDFLIGLRQYSADRANSMILNEGALGF